MAPPQHVRKPEEKGKAKSERTLRIKRKSTLEKTNKAGLKLGAPEKEKNESTKEWMDGKGKTSTTLYRTLTGVSIIMEGVTSAKFL